MKRPALLIGLAVLLYATACVSFVGGEGGGGISPSQFKFSRVVSPRGKGPGGWKMARLVITLVRASGQNVQDVFCQIQVQVPEINDDGVITDGVAQRAAAEAADEAVEIVLPQGLLSEEMCKRFRVEMERSLNLRIRGSRVTRFQ